MIEVILAILGGSFGAAIVTQLGGIILQKMKRRHEKEDKPITEVENEITEVEGEVAALQKHHDEDIRELKGELALILWGTLACLRGLHEQGCNGPVTEAIGKIEKYVNKKAHDI